MFLQFSSCRSCLTLERNSGRRTACRDWSDTWLEVTMGVGKKGLPALRTLLRVARCAPTASVRGDIEGLTREWYRHARASWSNAVQAGDPSPRVEGNAKGRVADAYATARWLRNAFARPGPDRRLLRAVRLVTNGAKSKYHGQAMSLGRSLNKRREARERLVDGGELQPATRMWMDGMHTLHQRYGIVSQSPRAVRAHSQSVSNRKQGLSKQD